MEDAIDFYKSQSKIDSEVADALSQTINRMQEILIESSEELYLLSELTTNKIKPK